MEIHRVIGKRGQASIEFILLLAMILLLIHTITLPYVRVAEGATSDVVRLSQAKLATQRIADAINIVGESGSAARQTFTVFVPPKSVIRCNTDSSRLEFDVLLELSNNIPLLSPRAEALGNNCTCDNTVGGLCVSAKCTGVSAVGPEFSCPPAEFRTDNTQNSFSQICKIVVNRNPGSSVNLKSMCG